MSPILALYMESRGSAAWGCTDGEYTHRVCSSISDTWQELWLGEKHGVIYHTRAPSCGSNIIPNTHPFEFTHAGKRVIGIHNGHIHNHDDLDRKHGRKFSVDSMHIFAHLAEGKSLEEIGGYGTIAWYEVNTKDPEARTLYLSHWGHNALHIAHLKSGEAVFCSTPKPIEVAARIADVQIEHWIKVTEKEKYSLEPDGQVLTHGMIPFGDKVVHVAHGSFHGATSATWTSDEYANMCVIPSCNNPVDRKKVIFCKACVGHFAHQYGIPFVQ